MSYNFYGSIFIDNIDYLKSFNDKYHTIKKTRNIKNQNECNDRIWSALEELKYVPTIDLDEYILPKAGFNYNFTKYSSINHLSFDIASITRYEHFITLINLIADISIAVNGAFKVDAGWPDPIPISLYLLNIAKSSKRKSSFISLNKKPISEMESKVQNEYDTTIKSIQEIAKDRLNRLKKDEKKEYVEVTDNLFNNCSYTLTDLNKIRLEISQKYEVMKKECEDVLKSVRPRLFIDDTTYSSFVSALSLNNCLNIFEPEPTFINNLIKSSGDDRLRNLVKKCFDNETITSDLYGKNKTIEKPNLNINIAIQPDVAFDFIKNGDLLNSGLIERFILLFANPNFNIPRLTVDKQYSVKVENEYKKFIQEIFEYCYRNKGMIQVSYEAKLILENFEYVNFDKINSNKHYLGFRNKSHGLAYRIAGCINLAENVTNKTYNFVITKEQAEDAVSMVNDILFHIFYATEPTWFQNYGNAIRIKDWFSSVDNKPKYPIFNENDVKKGLSFNKNKEDIKPSLEILIRHNFIREIPGLSTISEYIVRSDIIESPLLMQKLYDDQNTCNLVKNMMDQELNNNYTQNIQPQFPQTMPNAPVQLIGQYPYLPNMSFPSQQTNSFQYPQNTMNIPVQQSVQLALPMQVKDDIASYIPQFLLIAKRDNQISELIYNYLINQQDILLNGIEKHIVNKFNDDKILDSTFNTYVITILHAICDMIKNHLQNCGYLPSNNNLLDMITTYLYINQNEYPY